MKFLDCLHIVLSVIFFIIAQGLIFTIPFTILYNYTIGLAFHMHLSLEQGFYVSLFLSIFFWFLDQKLSIYKN